MLLFVGDTAKIASDPVKNFESTGVTMIDPKLLEILACPDCKGDIELWEEKARLVCQKCGKRYPIRDGIPIMLIEEAELPEEQTQSGQ